MKTIVFRISLCLIAGLCLLLQAAAVQAETPSRQREARSTDDSAVFLQDSALMEKILAQHQIPEFSEDGVPYVDRMLAQMGKHTYLVQRGWDTFGNCRSWAVEVATNKWLFPVVPPVGTIHSCTGDDCSSCSFTRNADGLITGCKCNGSGRCNHSITSGDF